MKLNLNLKFNGKLAADLPAVFEKHEIFVILAGIVIVFLFAGFLFYEKAYKVTIVSPEVSVDVPKVNAVLFEKTVDEFSYKKQAAPDLPIIDPFR